jgi:ADP-ribose pyrophosphatase YjhB (NUDIX family)
MSIKYPDFATSNQAVTVILRKDNKMAFLLRSKTDWMNGFYGLPGGRVDAGEQFTKAAARELLEETGLMVEAKHFQPRLVWQRHYDDGDWVDMVFEVTEWEGEPYNAEPDVHGELAWLDPKNLPDNVLSENKFLLQQIVAGNTYAEYGWS